MQPQNPIPLPGLLKLTHEAVSDELYARLGMAGFGDIRPAHGCVMGTIGDEGDRLTVLAERARMTKQGVGEAATDLERLGYIERVPDPADGRAKIIRLTERGHAARKVAFGVFSEIERRWAERYGAERVRELVDLLGEIVGAQSEAGDIRAAA